MMEISVTDTYRVA